MNNFPIGTTVRIIDNALGDPSFSDRIDMIAEVIDNYGNSEVRVRFDNGTALWYLTEEVEHYPS